MPTKALIPNIGTTDQLGTPALPWQAGYIKILYDDQGNAYAKLPINASSVASIAGSILDPHTIGQIMAAVVTLTDLPGTPTLAAIATQAGTGAGDPATRINAGLTLLDGAKIINNTIPLAKLSNAAAALATLLSIGTGGGWQSDDYAAALSGFIFAKGNIEVNLAGAIWRGILKGTINIASMFRVDVAGNTVWGDAVANPNNLHGIDANGQEWWGSDNWADAPLQADVAGNIYITDTPESTNRIDLGAIDATCRQPQPSQAGGQMSNGLLTLTPQTRGSIIWYTTNGNDPSDITAAGRTKYVNPIPVVLGAGQTLTVKSAAVKLGVWSSVVTWVFTGDPASVANPTFTPTPGTYKTANGQKQITLSSGTAGSTIRYTLDGTTPKASTQPGGPIGTVYAAPFNVGPGAVAINAIAEKAGLNPSAISTGNYNITKGGGGGGGGGHRPPGDN